MNEQPGGEIILYQRGDATAIDVRLCGKMVPYRQALKTVKAAQKKVSGQDTHEPN